MQPSTTNWIHFTAYFRYWQFLLSTKTLAAISRDGTKRFSHFLQPKIPCPWEELMIETVFDMWQVISGASSAQAVCPHQCDGERCATWPIYHLLTLMYCWWFAGGPAFPASIQPYLILVILFCSYISYSPLLIYCWWSAGGPAFPESIQPYLILFVHISLTHIYECFACDLLGSCIPSILYTTISHPLLFIYLLLSSTNILLVVRWGSCIPSKYTTISHPLLFIYLLLYSTYMLLIVCWGSCIPSKYTTISHPSQTLLFIYLLLHSTNVLWIVCWGSRIPSKYTTISHPLLFIYLLLSSTNILLVVRWGSCIPSKYTTISHPLLFIYLLLYSTYILLTVCWGSCIPG